MITAARTCLVTFGSGSSHMAVLSSRTLFLAASGRLDDYAPGLGQTLQRASGVFVSVAGRAWIPLLPVLVRAKTQAIGVSLGQARRIMWVAFRAILEGANASSFWSTRNQATPSWGAKLKSFRISETSIGGSLKSVHSVAVRLFHGFSADGRPSESGEALHDRRPTERPDVPGRHLLTPVLGPQPRPSIGHPGRTDAAAEPRNHPGKGVNPFACAGPRVVAAPSRLRPRAAVVLSGLEQRFSPLGPSQGGRR